MPFPVLEHPFLVLERPYLVLERLFPVFWFILGKWFCPGTSRDTEVCPGIFTLVLVPGQRDTGTRNFLCPVETLLWIYIVSSILRYKWRITDNLLPYTFPCSALVRWLGRVLLSFPWDLKTPLVNTTQVHETFFFWEDLLLDSTQYIY